MNFLAHFYFDGVDGAPSYNLGLVLPDLMGMVRRGWKLKQSHLQNHVIPVHKAIASGASAHLQMDDWFHKTDFFIRGRSLVKATLEEAGVTYPPYRPGFLSHVLLELLLDRLIVLHYTSMVSKFYRELAIVSVDWVRSFFESINLTFDDNFPAFFTQFINNQFAFRYAYDTPLLEALNQIAKRVSQPVFKDDQMEDLKARLKNLDVSIFDIFGDLNNDFHT
jgi:acyl carrier protein phosphodiesterase